MKKNYFILLLLLGVTTNILAHQIFGRTVFNMNFDWYFHRGDIALSELSDKNVKHTISHWQQVDVPHDFQIEQPWITPTANETSDASDQASNFKSRLSARGFKEMGTGWYVKLWKPDSSLVGQRILIDFEGIMYMGDVYFNGQHIGATDYGYIGFECDLTNKIKWGQDNVIAIKANTGGATNSRWYTGGGLFRDVHIIATDPQLYFTRHPLYITTSQNKYVHIQAEVANLKLLRNIRLKTCIFDANGKTVYERISTEPYNRKMKQNELQLSSILIDQPHIWSCEDPYLYTAVVSLLDSTNKVIDQTHSRFGIRTISFSPEHGFLLNGKKVLLKGIANHHTLGALGAAAYPRAIKKRLLLLKDFGFNHIRTSHNPYSESFLDLCDEMGFLVVDELYDKWLTQYAGGRRPWMQLWPYDLPEWIKRDRNHPSIIVWSLGNELQTYPTLPFSDWGVTPYRMMKPVLQRYDTTRPITVAMHPRGRSMTTDSIPAPLVFETDIAAYNYRYMYFPGDHKRYPHMIFYQSEANTSMMGQNFYGMNLEQVMGLAYWGQIDYLGESRGWPYKGWNDGTFDISLQPKPQAYLLRSMFKPQEPIIHIGIVDQKADATEWNGIVFNNDGMSDHWNRIPNKRYTVNVYSNCAKVALYVNGKKVGEQLGTTDPLHRNKFQFKEIEYHPGYIEAIGYNEAGNVATRHRIETASVAERLKLEADKEVWMADGQDLMHVRITACDKKGRRVWAACNQLTFQVSGDAKIIGVDNGDLSSSELHVGNHRSLYGGTALVILRAGRQAGKVTLTVSTNHLRTQRLQLHTHEPLP